VSNSQKTLAGVQWQEPIEGLEFGELFLGGIASSYFAHGRIFGFGFCFTDRRIIGLRMRRVALTLKAPFVTLIGVVYLVVILEALSGTALLAFLLPIVLHLANWPITAVTSRTSESFLSKNASDPSKLMKRRRDFELRRNQIEEMLMKSPGKSRNILRMGSSGGYLKITLKDYHSKPIEIKIHGWKQHQKLRELVINFSSREPKIRALEYP
jgi:hypothetical protein